MPRQIFYGSYHDQKNKKKKKFMIALIIIIVLMIAAIVYLFLTDTGGIGQAVRSSVGEITELKMQLQEKDDRIAELEQEVEQYKQELALRPAPSTTPIPPPNDQVAGAWLPTIPSATQAPTTSRRTKKPSATAKPKATKAPAATQQPAAAVTPPPATTVTQPPQQPPQPEQSSGTGEAVGAQQ